MNETNPKRNAEGYMDLTPYEAIRNIDQFQREQARIGKLMKTLFYVIDLAGFELQGRITLVDKTTRNVHK